MLDDADLAELAAWVELYKRHRDLLHGGDFVRIDHDDPHAFVHGVLAADRRSGLIAYVQLTTSQAQLPRPVRVPELDPELRYRVELLAGAGRRDRSVADARSLAGAGRARIDRAPARRPRCAPAGRQPGVASSCLWIEAQ